MHKSASVSAEHQDMLRVRHIITTHTLTRAATPEPTPVQAHSRPNRRHSSTDPIPDPPQSSSPSPPSPRARPCCSVSSKQSSPAPELTPSPPKASRPCDVSPADCPQPPDPCSRTASTRARTSCAWPCRQTMPTSSLISHINVDLAASAVGEPSRDSHCALPISANVQSRACKPLDHSPNPPTTTGRIGPSASMRESMGPSP